MTSIFQNIKFEKQWDFGMSIWIAKRAAVPVRASTWAVVFYVAEMLHLHLFRSSYISGLLVHFANLTKRKTIHGFDK